MADRNQRVLRQRAPVGNAILYRIDRLEPCVVADAPVSRLGKKKRESMPATRVAVLLQGVAGSALGGVLHPTCFFSLHLDATDEEKRVSQLAKW